MMTLKMAVRETATFLGCFSILHFHMGHNVSPHPPPPNFAFITIVFTVIPRRNWRHNSYGYAIFFWRRKGRGINKVHCGLCKNGEIG